MNTLKYKQRRRNLIKKLYARACAGDTKAIYELRQLTRKHMPIQACEYPGCGIPVRGYTCKMHMPRRAHMAKKQLAAIL